MRAEINELTKRMLAMGYTLDDENWQAWPAGVWRCDYYNWGYSAEWKYTPTWESPCGLLIHRHGDFWGACLYMDGTAYCGENDNPIFECPTLQKVCEHRLKDMPNGLNCVFHRTLRQWDYEKSWEKAMDERKARMAAARQYHAQHEYCCCEKHEELPDGSFRYYYQYDVHDCISNHCENQTCAARHNAVRNLERVNIYYDMRVVRRWTEGFMPYEETSINKGIKVFDKGIARTDAKIVLRMWDVQERQVSNEGRLRDRWSNAPFYPHIGKLSKEMYFARHHRQWNERMDFEIEAFIENARIARTSRDARDLQQDLQDIANGFKVTHASDEAKAAEAKKREAKVERRKAKQIKSDKRLVDTIRAEGNDEKYGRILNNALMRLEKNGVSMDEEKDVHKETQQQMSMFDSET